MYPNSALTITVDHINSISAAASHRGSRAARCVTP